MRLLIVTQVLDKEDPAYFGFFHAWVEEFAKHCEHVTVICLREGVHALPANVSVYSLGKEHGRPMLGSLAYGVRFVRLAWRLRSHYDAVFVHMNPEYVVLAGWMWRMLGKKVSLWYLHRSVDLKLRIAALFVDHIVTASKESLRLHTRKSVIVGHGIDPHFVPHAKIPSDRLRLMYWGRLSPSKQVEKIIAAVAVLRARGKKVSLMVIGAAARPADQPYVTELKRQATALGEGAVRFAGGVPHHEIPGYLQEADVCVNISTTQSMDKTVLEAMAAGVPVVASNEAFRNVLEPRGLYAADLSPESLADTIERAAVSDPSEFVSYVRREHSLQTLIPRILTVLS